MDGEKTITCSDGKWNHKAPTCSLGRYKSRCQDVWVATGFVIVKIDSALWLIFFLGLLCQNCCVLIYSIFVNLFYHDDFAFSLGIVEGCFKPRHSSNGNVLPNKDLYNDGDTVRMSCNWNYVLDGDSSARCSNGKWNNDPPSCKRKNIDILIIIYCYRIFIQFLFII